MTDAQRERMFQPFGRVDDRGPARGVGLGLSVARGFMEAMDVLIADGSSGDSLAMRLRLPLAK